MLTGELVNARRRGTQLVLSTMDDETRRRAIEIATELLRRARGLVGGTREEVEAAMKSVDVAPREHRLRDGLAKLIVDSCVFDSTEDVDVPALRHDVFARASAMRAALSIGKHFDRGAVLAAVAAERNTPCETIEQLLFADLRGAQVLRACDAPSAESLVSKYPWAQAQAVLLRAVRVTVDVECASAFALRAFFRRLKFLRLLHTIHRQGQEGGVRILIDGPFSLFESVTKYGLQLALVLPLLEECKAWELSADILWGKDRLPLVFRMAGGVLDAPSREDDGETSSDDVRALVRSFEALETKWRVLPASDILDMPGVGLCVPDLVFEARGAEGAPVRVYLEVMGYWSRAAVWQRVELVRAGLRDNVLFAVSSRLRVSEEALGRIFPERSTSTSGP